MFQPSWRGTTNCKLGLYNSNPNKKIYTADISDTPDTSITVTHTADTFNTSTSSNVNPNVNPNINPNDDDTAILDIKNSNYNFKTYKIPYYNVNFEYLQNNINNQDKNNTNYYNLLDRIGYISRYLLKGNDYYRLYISKNSNKYFCNDNNNDDTMTIPINDKVNTIVNPMSNDNTINDYKEYDNTINDTMTNDTSDISNIRNNKYIKKKS